MSVPGWATGCHDPDGGPCRAESTVVSFIEKALRSRPGGISGEDIEQVLGPIVSPVNTASPHSPGQLASHYAPKARLRLNAASAGNGEAYLGFGSRDGKYNLSPSGNLIEAAANLFRMLHELDEQGATAIAVAPIPMTGLGEAINDRLSRAAAPRAHP
jgi:L-threonylcarbamoyladenylate synthase